MSEKLNLFIKCFFVSNVNRKDPHKTTESGVKGGQMKRLIIHSKCWKLMITVSLNYRRKLLSYTKITDLLKPTKSLTTKPLCCNVIKHYKSGNFGNKMWSIKSTNVSNSNALRISQLNSDVFLIIRLKILFLFSFSGFHWMIISVLKIQNNLLHRTVLKRLSSGFSHNKCKTLIRQHQLSGCSRHSLNIPLWKTGK